MKALLSLALLLVLLGAPLSARATSPPSLLRTMTAVSFALPDDAHPASFKGWGPKNLWAAYNLPSATSPSTATVAIVDAYHDPTIVHDLAVYRAHYGLPACRGCLRQVDQSGGHHYPPVNRDWAVEESLDVEMVAALCPRCHIVLIDAADASLESLYTAEQYAASLHPAAISNSWGSPEPPASAYPCSGISLEMGFCLPLRGQLDNLALLFFFPHVATVFSSGDSGYGPSVPADSPYVVAVGGTSLRRTSNARGWWEQAWNGSGSGCSLVDLKPLYQKDALCQGRTIADISFDADPWTGVAVYDSLPYYSHKHHAWKHGWLVVGGTSVGAPAIAALYGLANNARFMHGGFLSPGSGAFLYAHAADFHDIVHGTNAPRMTGYHQRLYLIQASAGYDGVTGLGTPDGLGAF